MALRRFFGAAFAVFIFIFFYEWLVHGVLLMDNYKTTPQLWRDFSVIDVFTMAIHTICQFLFAVWTAFVFTQLYPFGGLWNGLRFGVFFGVFAGFLTGMWYFYLPVTAKLGWSWFVGSVGEGVLIGIILGLTYRRQLS